jgi:TRAP transporter 4TM/12TM fusion protein
MFLFLVFGAFLLRSGASDWFSRLSMALVGHRTGGTAKAAVTSSAIIGSITGSAAANAAVTGSVTIPQMKSAGFQSHVAGGIEAAASTGGTVLPPVMGVAAFIMVALTGIPYATIAIYSAVPAVLYFFFVYAQVHFYARRQGLSGTPREKLPPTLKTFLSGWYYLLPIAVVVVLIARDYSLAYIALLAIVSALLTSWIRRESRMGPRAIINAMSGGAQQALPIMVIAGPVAVLSQALLLPGTGLRITGMILNVASGNLAITLVLIFIVAYVLGMGLSVVPAYIILATLAAPALIQLHVPVLPAHLLVMWWSQASNITPPVALAVYVTASIAGSPLWPTGWAAVLKGAGLFFLPVLFIYQPGLLFEGGVLNVTITIGSIIVGIVACAAAIEGFFRHPLSPVPRAIIGIGGIVLILGHHVVSVAIGLAVTLVGVFIADRMTRAVSESRVG